MMRTSVKVFCCVFILLCFYCSLSMKMSLFFKAFQREPEKYGFNREDVVVRCLRGAQGLWPSPRHAPSPTELLGSLVSAVFTDMLRLWFCGCRSDICPRTFFHKSFSSLTWAEVCGSPASEGGQNRTLSVQRRWPWRLVRLAKCESVMVLVLWAEPQK